MSQEDELFGKLVANVGDKAVRFENLSTSLQRVARMARGGRLPGENGQNG